MSEFSGSKIMRRVAGYHDVRMDGMVDVVVRARGASVLDIGCNRGLVGFEMANNGARLVHGCDIDPDCITVARHIFADLRNCESQFEVCDLREGPGSMKPFFLSRYDIVVMLATYHKLKRVMKPADLEELMLYIGGLTGKYFAWRATSDQHEANEEEAKTLDCVLGQCGLRRIHTSYISDLLGIAAVWAR